VRIAAALPHLTARMTAAKEHYRKSRSHDRFAHLCVDPVRGQSRVGRWALLRRKGLGAGQPLTSLATRTGSPAAGSNGAVNFDDRLKQVLRWVSRPP
jgi:hypothetical protein